MKDVSAINKLRGGTGEKVMSMADRLQERTGRAAACQARGMGERACEIGWEVECFD